MLKKKLVSLLALALSSMMLLSACVGNADGDTQGGNGGEGTQTNASGEVVKDANELVIGTYMPVTTLVPWKTTSDGDGYILRQIYHTLVEMDEQSNFVPSLATEWQCSEDGLTWTVKIRDDVYWQTGNGLFDEKSKSRQKTSNSRMTTIWTRQTALCAIQNFPSL